MIESTANTLLVSVVTGWELAIKQQFGRLDLGTSFAAAAELLDAAIIPIEPDDLPVYLDLPLHHRDPFDRMLIAQSLRHAAPLISRDRQLRLYEADVIW